MIFAKLIKMVFKTRINEHNMPITNCVQLHTKYNLSNEVPNEKMLENFLFSCIYNLENCQRFNVCSNNWWKRGVFAHTTIRQGVVVSLIYMWRDVDNGISNTVAGRLKDEKSDLFSEYNECVHWRVFGWCCWDTHTHTLWC